MSRRSQARLSERALRHVSAEPGLHTALRTWQWETCCSANHASGASHATDGKTLRRGESRPGHGPGRVASPHPEDGFSRAVERFAGQHVSRCPSEWVQDDGTGERDKVDAPGDRTPADDQQSRLNGDHCHATSHLPRPFAVLTRRPRHLCLRAAAAGCAAAAAARHRQCDRSAVSRAEQQPLHRVPGDARGHHHERSDQPRLRALAEGGDRDAVQGAGPLRPLHAPRLGPCLGRRRLCRHRGVRRPPQHAGRARASGWQSAVACGRREDGWQQERARRARRGVRRHTPNALRCSTTTATR